MVHLGVRRGVCAGVGLRVSPRGLAVRAGGDCLVHRGSSAMVARGTGKLIRYRMGSATIFHVLAHSHQGQPGLFVFAELRHN